MYYYLIFEKTLKEKLDSCMIQGGFWIFVCRRDPTSFLNYDSDPALIIMENFLQYEDKHA